MIVGHYPGIGTPMYREEISGHPEYHPICWIEYVTSRQAKWTEQKERYEAERAEFHASTNASYLIAVAFDPRLSGVPGRVDEFIGAGGQRRYRIVPKGELPEVEVRGGTASYPDTPRNRQLRAQGIIIY